MKTYKIIKGVVLSDGLEMLQKTYDPQSRDVLIMAGQTGAMRVMMNGKEHLVEQGDMLFLPARTLQDVHPSDDYKGYVLSVPADTLENILYYCLMQDKDLYREFELTAHNPILHLDARQQRLGRIFQELFQIYAEDSGPYKEQIILAFCQVIIFELLTWLEEHTRKEDIPEESKTDRQDLHFQNFILLVQREQGKTREVSWYAQELGITPKYLAHLCKEKSGKTPLSLINNLCIYQIKLLLQNTTLSAKEIAFEMRFPNASMFSKFFRMHTGLTPLEYRRQNQ